MIAYGERFARTDGAAAFVVEAARVSSACVAAFESDAAPRGVARPPPRSAPRTASAETARESPDVPAMEFFLPEVDAAADDGAAVRARVEDDGALVTATVDHSEVVR